MTEQALVKSYRINHNFKLYDFDQRRRTISTGALAKMNIITILTKSTTIIRKNKKIMLANLRSQEDENPKYRPRYTVSQDK